MTDRRIIHLDLDAFFCAVEERLDPSLCGKPFAVGGRPEHRGVVASCSYAARRFGVRSAMPMGRAIKLCPDLFILHHHFHDYSSYSRQVMEILREAAPLVEQISIDEAFMEATEIEGTDLEVAKLLQSRVNNELSLPCSLGVATNKLVAKTATEVGKATNRSGNYPNAILVVPPGTEAEFMAPLPIQMLWGVGPKTAERLQGLGISKIGDIAAWPVEELGDRFGQIGYDLFRRARGIDDRPLQTSHEAKSISQEVTFSKDVSDPARLRETIRHHSERVANSLKKSKLAGATVKIKLRWPDYTTLTRQTTLSHPTDDANTIYETALSLFETNWRRGSPIRLLGVGVTGLQPPARQLTLWDAIDYNKQARLLSALETLKGQFGDSAIRKASELRE